MNRRTFIRNTSAVMSLGSVLPSISKFLDGPVDQIGVQLYSFRNAMLKDPLATLELIAEIGFREIETASSKSGHYYGMTPDEMKYTCRELGMNLRSGHVHLDDQFEQTMDEAVKSGQEYLICSSMPSNGQTVDNYKRVADAFNKAGEECRKNGLKFGYHNHEYEFESDGNVVLFDVLMENTEPELVHMELDLGWVVAAGKDPIAYFERYPGRFPLWHLKDMNLEHQESTEFGKGGLDIARMIKHMSTSGVRYIFVEQEEYALSPEQSMRHNLKYLSEL